MKPDDTLQTAVFVDLAPPSGGLDAVRERLRRRQQVRRLGGGLALAALALLVVLPILLAPAPRTAMDWSGDILAAEPLGEGPQVHGRGTVGVLEVGRTPDTVMVRVLPPSSPRETPNP
jgi:hypothetical protein